VFRQRVPRADGRNRGGTSAGKKIKLTRHSGLGEERRGKGTSAKSGGSESLMRKRFKLAEGTIGRRER